MHKFKKFEKFSKNGLQELVDTQGQIEDLLAQLKENRKILVKERDGKLGIKNPS